jgi:SpoVK/Ycf46/Vps4 family AAA+-type ATPase
MREEKGLPGTAIPKNLVFSGNPGTGKSSVARIVANIYRELGIFKKGHVTEVDRAKLVTANSGQTASKIREAVSSTRGGILLIDEAYSLVQDRAQVSDGLESVDALVKAMDDHKDAVVVILGGCPDKLAEFINSHSSLKTRFTKSFSFEDYTPDQMLDIFDLFGARAAFKTSPTARALVRALFEELHSQRREGFGNARDVRRVFEGIIGNQANRVINLPQVNEEILSTITDEDVLPFVAALERR